MLNLYDSLFKISFCFAFRCSYHETKNSSLSVRISTRRRRTQYASGNISIFYYYFFKYTKFPPSKQAILLEGKYWKRKCNVIKAEYKKWRRFYVNRALGATNIVDTVSNRPFFARQLNLDAPVFIRIYDLREEPCKTKRKSRAHPVRLISRESNKRDVRQAVPPRHRRIHHVIMARARFRNRF